LAVVGREPWIVSGPRYLIVGSPLTPEATSFPVSASFLPWLADVLSARLHADPGGGRSAAPGERVALPPGIDALESAGGGRMPVNGSAVDAPGTAGTYFLIQGGRRVGALVVNPEVAESRLERWAEDDLTEHVVSTGARVARDRDDWVKRTFSGTARRQLSAPLLFLILLTLGAEMLAATTGGRAKQ
ncbi:MAG: hypothetical protein ACRENU_04010, partial [Gemmatimonadaceae bacterium]